MLQTFIIALREGVEAALVIAIAIAYLRKTGRTALLSTVYRAVVAAVIACFLGAWAFSKIEINSEAYEGYTLLISAGFVLSMVIWMNRHGKKLKGEIETKLQQSPESGGAFGVFAFVFLMIFREGVETVLLLTAVRMDTQGMLSWLGAGLGVAAAVLFGISFIRGTIRVNLGQFFRMTTVILIVVVAQLAITGLHELSEGQLIPSSEAEMALIGPVVKNDAFFFVTILALAGAMLLFEWRKRRAPRTAGLEGAELRKVVWLARRERMWMTASVIASSLFILMITAEFIYAREATALSAATPVTLTDGAVRLPVDSFKDGKLHRFSIDDQGVHVRFIVIRRADDSLAVAFDACAICGTQGYYQKGAEVVCRNCASNIVISTIGIAGGCNPVPLKSHVDGGTLVIDGSAFDLGIRVFRKG